MGADVLERGIHSVDTQHQIEVLEASGLHPLTQVLETAWKRVEA
jgi:hypothetical protein